MSALAALLLLLVGATHYGYDLIALAYGGAPAVAKAWFYILRGVEGLALFAVVAVAYRRHRAVLAVCLLGMVEEGQTAACRMSQPIGDLPAYLPAFEGLCGPAWYWVGLCALGLVALGIAYELGGRKRGPGTT